MARLEIIVQNLQNPMVSLEDALANYQEGVELVQFCQNKLTAAEQLLQVLDQNQLRSLELEENE
ncbi:hypothetical protein HpSP79_20160 [Helicobacter pylori]